MITTQSILPLYPILISFIASGLIAISGRFPNLREAWTFVAGLCKLGCIVYMLPWILKGEVLKITLLNLLPNLSIALRVDAFGMMFAIVASSLWILTSMYSVGYMRPLKEHAQTRYYCFFALALSATIGVAFAANLFTMYVFYEILSLSTYPLVTHHQDKEARGGGRKYLSYLLGTSIGFLLPAMILSYVLGGTLDFSANGVFSTMPSLSVVTLLFFLFIFGFAKSGIMPFHSWLPGAMVAPTPVSALLHAVAVVKVGVFCIFRVMTGIFGVSMLQLTQLPLILCILASITILVSSLIALSQDNLKRLLAFSTIGQLSYIILGVALLSASGLKGSMLHIVMHAFGKITLFFCAGAIFVATGKKYISQMKGIGRKMPFTMAAFTLAALSIIGFPPLGGFLSKIYLIVGALEAQYMWVMLVLLTSSFLNAAYFFPIIYKAFFLKPDDETNTGIKEAPLLAMLPPVITAICSITLFLYPSVFNSLADLMLQWGVHQ
ncbi:MAG: monovalent cation/H+ antiporter subunit D family protein [bacterium]